MAKRGASGLNMLLGIDKPAGITSHDVVARMRSVLAEKRVGHAGTLDPLASGVLVVGVGQATRLMSYATDAHKCYVARMVFGRETVTDDAEGQTRCEALITPEVLDASWAASQVARLCEIHEQVPPAYCAMHQNGVRAYDAARRGKPLTLEPRPCAVYDAILCAIGTADDGAPWWDIAVEVSKGTYVRALVRDLGRALGSAAYVGALRRTASGTVTLADCEPLDVFETRSAAELHPLDPVDLLGIPMIEIDEHDVQLVHNGMRLSAARYGEGSEQVGEEGSLIALVHEGRLFAIARYDGDALAPQTVFDGGIAGVEA